MKKLVCVILCLSALCFASVQGFGFAYAAPATPSSVPDEPPAAGEATQTDAPLSEAEETTAVQAVVRKTDTLKEGATFYVVGNPDCYPYEYYDPETENYEGLLPRMLGEIADKNGFSLLYFNSSDSRQSLAENSQGEIFCIYTVFVLTGRMLDGREKRVALLSALMVGFLSAAEFIGVYYDQSGGDHLIIHTAVKFTELSLTPALLFAMGLIMNPKRPFRWVALPIILSFALEAVMLPFRLVFYIDEANVYHHGRFYWIYLAMIVISAVFLCVEFFIMARKLQSRHSFYCILSVLLPLICFLAHIVVPEISMSWLGVSIAFILMYSAHCSVKLCNDHITRLLDRSSFDADLQAMKKGSTLIFFDINKFKQLNDDHGHIVGDEYLSSIARFIREAYGKVGRCYRIGGDEFAVIISRKNADVKQVNDTFLSLLDKARESDPLLPRISIGTCTYTGENQTKKDVFNTADMRMYSNKAEGSSGVD